MNPTWQQLNDLYVKESGMESRPSLDKEWKWAAWATCGFTPDNLVLVLRYLRKEVVKGNRKPACKTLRVLIEDHGNFEKELCLAKESAMNKKETPRQEILRAVHRAEPLKEPVKVGDVINSNKAFELFRQKMREQGL